MRKLLVRFRCLNRLNVCFVEQCCYFPIATVVVKLIPYFILQKYFYILLTLYYKDRFGGNTFTNFVVAMSLLKKKAAINQIHYKNQSSSNAQPSLYIAFLQL